MHVDVGTLYGNKVSLDFELPEKAKEFKVSVTSQNIHQSSYSHITGNADFTTKKISNVAELISVLSELDIPEKISSRIQLYSQHNTKFKASSYDFFKWIFSDNDEDFGEESCEEVDIHKDPPSTLWGFVEDVPKTDEFKEKKYDETKLETIRQNTCKLIRLLLNDERLMIELEGNEPPEISGKIEPSMDRLAMGELLLNLQKHSFDKLDNEQRAEAISNSLIDALKNNMFSILDQATFKQNNKLDALIKTIARDCIDAGLSTAISLEESEEIAKPNKTEIITIRRAGMRYIAQALKEMESIHLENTEPVIAKLQKTSKYLDSNKNILQVMALVKDAHEDIIEFHEKNNLKPSHQIIYRVSALENKIENAGFKNLRSFDF